MPLSPDPVLAGPAALLGSSWRECGETSGRAQATNCDMSHDVAICRNSAESIESWRDRWRLLVGARHMPGPRIGARLLRRNAARGPGIAAAAAPGLDLHRAENDPTTGQTAPRWRTVPRGTGIRAGLLGPDPFDRDLPAGVGDHGRNSQGERYNVQQRQAGRGLRATSMGGGGRERRATQTSSTVTIMCGSEG